MAKYTITVKEVEEYPETTTVYEGDDGKRYYSMYHENISNKTVKISEKAYPTGKMLYREREIYSQDFDGTGIEEIIKAVNGIK